MVRTRRDQYGERKSGVFRGLRAGAIGALGAIVVASCAGAPVNAETPPQPAPPKAEALATSQKQTPFGHYLAGRYAYATRDFGSAAEYLMLALSEDPDNSSLMQRTLTLLIADGRMEDAVDVASRLIDVDPESKIAQLVLLADEVRAERFDAAEKRVSGLAREGIYVLLAPLMEAWIEYGSGKPDAAIAALEPLAERQAYEPYFAFHAALINELAGRTAAAEENYRKAIVAVPGGTQRVVNAYGAFLELAGRRDDAKAVYEVYRENNPDSIWLEPVIERFEAGEKPERSVNSAGEGLAEAFFGAASALPQDGGDAGLLYSRLALYLRPNFPIAQLLVGEIMETLGRTEAAVEAYDMVDHGSPFYWTARLRAASGLARLERTDEAVAELWRLVEERKDRSDAAITLGDVLRMEERYDEAVKAYDIAVERTPVIEARHWSLLYARGVTLERTKHWDRAEADFLHALELQPDQPLVLNYLGYSWVEQGVNLERAKSMIEQAVSLRPNDGYIVDSLGWVLYRLGELDGAVEYLERAVELRSDDPIINDHLGDIYWEVGRQVEAKFQWQRALTLGAEEELAAEIRRKLVKGLTAEATPPEGTE